MSKENPALNALILFSYLFTTKRREFFFSLVAPYLKSSILNPALKSP